MTPSEGQPTIIDTDPGIDDAIAILLALASPEIRVLGITTVAGNIGLDTTTRNAGRLLALAGRADIPVLRGAAGPLVRAPQKPLDIHGNDGVGGVPLPEPERPAEAGSAVEWMAEVLHAAAPGTIDLFALGPLTNIACLMKADPQAARRIRRIVAMGGAVHEPGNMGLRAEFNFATDPEAAALVLEAGLPIVLIPLDVTRRVRASRAFVAKLAASDSTSAQVTAALIESYFASTSGPDSRPLHDPCVVLFALNPDLFRTSPLRFTVEVGRDAGALVIDRAASAGAEVALAVDAESAAKLLHSRLVTPAMRAASA
jgi:purine nucleosidase/pyrimidine-specific ribonucleoside hydrolase